MRNSRLPLPRRGWSACPLHRVLLAVPLLLAGCQSPNEYQEPPPPTVTVANPVLQRVFSSIDFTGNTEPVNMVDIRARVEGFLTSIDFEEGEEVKAGDLLFTIDPRPFEAQLAQAEARVKLAHARVASGQADEKRALAETANASTQLARSEKAAASGAVTPAEIDVLKTAVLTARAGVDAAKAAITSAEAEIAAGEALVTQAKLNLDYTQVRSPIQGRAGRRLVDVGNLVGSGDSTVLTNVIQYDPIDAYFAINENDLLAFNRQNLTESESSKESTDKEIKLNQEVYVGLGDEEGYPHKGRADFADLAVDQSTGTFTIRAKVPNPNRLIPPGSFIRVRVPRKEIDALLIDERAIGRDQSGAYLLVVGTDNLVERRTITLGAMYEGKRAVSGPIESTDRVIVRGIQRARPGSKVAPQELAPESETETPTSPASSSPDGAE